MERLAPVYLFYGDETLLRDRKALELAGRLAPTENPDYNRESLQGPDVDLDRLLASCETLAIGDPHRLVLVRNIDLRLAAAHPEFVAYLRKPNPSTILILTAAGAVSAGKKERTAPPVGGKRSSAKAALSAKDLIALIPAREEFSSLRSDQALEFVRQAARARGVELESDATRLLIELVGVDAARLEDEVEKAALYAGKRNRVRREDVEALVRQTRSHTVFELTDAIAEGDRSEVLRQLASLLAEGNEPLALLGMVSWHFRRTLKGATMSAQGAPAAEIGRSLGIHFRLQERFAATCRKLGSRRAAVALIAVSNLDRELKSATGDPRLRLERTLLALLPAR